MVSRSLVRTIYPIFVVTYSCQLLSTIALLISPVLPFLPCFCPPVAYLLWIALDRSIFLASYCQPAIDDPHKVVKVIAADGKSGDTREISYSNCKVIGNGSFGVVFQAKLVGAPKESEDIAIKKVLQDKRFKVSLLCLRKPSCVWGWIGDFMLQDDADYPLLLVNRTANYKL